MSDKLPQFLRVKTSNELFEVSKGWVECLELQQLVLGDSRAAVVERQAVDLVDMAYE